MLFLSALCHLIKCQSKLEKLRLKMRDGEFTLGGPSKALVQYSLALSTSWQYVGNAFANLLWDFNCDFTLTARLHIIALLKILNSLIKPVSQGKRKKTSY